MTQEPWPQYARLYPEIGHAGSLQAALTRGGHELTAVLTSSPGWRDCATRVGDGHRHVTALAASQERWFLMKFWDRGVMMAEPDRVVEAAQAAEAAGWEALLVWDHLAYAWGVPSADPWVVLAAVAQATTRLRLGTAVTPLPRRRPAVVASTVATLDRLSGGRVIFGAGLGGATEEFTSFGEPDGASDRAAMLDEGLDVVAALWSGQPVRHAGRFYQVDGVTLAPLPLRPVGGGRFDIAITGVSAGPGDPVPDTYAQAGATWWLEHIHGRRGSHASMMARINAGPPGARE